jgi:DNA repair protein SbcC/Rad50
LNKELLLSKNKGIIEPYQHKINKLCFNDKCNNCKNNRDEINEIEIYNLNNIRDENEIFEDINILMLEEKKNKLYDLEKKLKYIEKDCNDEINENKIKIKQNENNKNEFENNKNSKLINLQKEVDEYLLLLENNKLLEIDNNIDIKIEKKQEKINKKQKELKSLKEVIQNEKEIEERLKELKKVKKNFEKYEEIKIELNQIINIEKYNEKELKIKKDIDNILNKKYGEILGVEEIYNEKIKELDDYKEQYNKVIKVVDLYEKNNFIGFIMDNYVKRLEILINNILMSIVDYKVKIEQDIDELRIYKIENEAMINIRQLSGNEKFLINIAVKSALNNMSVSFKTNFFIIDEGFGSCDEIRLKKINNLLDLLNNEFELCLVISHLDIIKSKKNKEINIRRNSQGFSYIE